MSTTAIFGAGVMGETLLSGLLRSGRPTEQIVITEKRPEHAALLRDKYGVRVLDNVAAAALADSLGEGHYGAQLDVTDYAGFEKFVDEAEAELGPLYAIVNNAGLTTVGAIAKSDPEAEMRMIEVDVVAVADLCSRFLPGMVERGTGAVLNVASTAAFQPLPGQAGYAAGKAFVLSYTRSLHGELAGTGVTATALCPGPVKTGFGEAAGITEEDADKALPKFMWEDADSVARCGLDGLAKGHPVAIPGLANRLGANLAHLVPKRLLVPILSRQHPALRD